MADLIACAGYASDPLGARWVPPLPEGDGEELAAFYERCRLEGALLALVIADAEDGSYLGELMLVMAGEGLGELGIGLLPASRRRGLASAAFGCFTEWCRSALGLARLEVLVACENAAALRLAERAGFQLEARLRSRLEHQGERFDAFLLSLLPEDPRPAVVRAGLPVPPELT